jgi:hypothetical protein
MAGRMPQFPAIVGVSRSRKGLISSVADERADLVRVFLYLHIVSADQGARPSGLGVMPDIARTQCLLRCDWGARLSHIGDVCAAGDTFVNSRSPSIIDLGIYVKRTVDRQATARSRR